MGYIDEKMMDGSAKVERLKSQTRDLMFSWWWMEAGVREKVKMETR